MRLLILTICLAFSVAVRAQVYVISNGSIRFFSEAKHELIRASSNQLRGAIDFRKKSFVFRIDIISFMGFNNSLQREHFNENYMETEQYPYASYTGKIIEDIDVTKDGEYDIRSKGKLTIHGVEQERIIKSHVSCRKGVITVQSEFVVLLADHNIKIPRIVYDKLAPNINVTVNATFVPNS